jgi:hypothetical protein
VSRAERKPTEVGDARDEAYRREPVAAKGDSRILTLPPSGDGSGDTLNGQIFIKDGSNPFASRQGALILEIVSRGLKERHRTRRKNRVLVSAR